MLGNYVDSKASQAQQQPPLPMNDHYAALIDNYLKRRSWYHNHPSGDNTDSFTEARDRLVSYENSTRARMQSQERRRQQFAKVKGWFSNLIGLNNETK